MYNLSGPTMCWDSKTFWYVVSLCLIFIISLVLSNLQTLQAVFHSVWLGWKHSSCVTSCTFVFQLWKP